ncbi:Uncharacterised protein [Mycobacteroides abscessus subsp. abscessus]|nr:Uncharacterised protein [Mycobacteroides abscessus subsp. abscessus]SHV02711.1 Uncharacterised protein [Mycobacteroides abscessus subsp. abscessus]SHW25373.1 Uncharacterised protein [Mycobacteroides abscessus subsp. abscessus]SHW88407.1 Uncharacterised protein [Mycobacteroides abscessus subsp. abscessus]SHY77305.1 Uncharacterised protein [Mycobacteroides abscessus subsp. abscessus]
MKKARWAGDSEGQKVRREVCAELKARCAASLGGVLGGLRIGGAGGREAFWDGGNGPSGRLTDGAARGLGSGCASETREVVKRVL